MNKLLKKKLNDKAILAGIFAFASLGILYFFVSATVNNTEAPTITTAPKQSISQTKDQNIETLPNGMKRYRSERLKVKFEYPSDYSIDERITTVILKNISKSGEIIFSKYGTNFENVSLFLNNVISKWKNKPDIRVDFMSSNFKGELIHNQADDYNIIYFVKDYSVYQFETGDSLLFQDLETIAKSFKILE